MSSAQREPEALVVTSADGTLIAGERRGAGPAVVIVDGALCHRGFGPTRAIARELASSFTTYSYDRRGRGGSGDTQPYRPELEYDDLAAVIASAGGEAAVVALSSGGALAARAAAAGVRMRGLAIYEAPFVGVHERQGRPMDYVGDLSRYLERGDRGAAVRYFMVDVVEQPAFSIVIMRTIPGLWRSLTAVAPTLIYDSHIMGDYRVPTRELASIQVPALVLGGGKAAPDMAGAVQELGSAIPTAEVRILPKQTHQVKPRVLADAVRPFLLGSFS